MDLDVSKLEEARDKATAERRHADAAKLVEKITITKTLIALETERDSYVTRKLPDRVAEVDTQIRFWCKKLGVAPPKRIDPDVARRAAEQKAAKEAEEAKLKQEADERAAAQAAEDAARAAARATSEPAGATAAAASKQQTR